MYGGVSIRIGKIEQDKEGYPKKSIPGYCAVQKVGMPSMVVL